MGNFNSCCKILLTSDASHAWIALHRCIEAYAKTSGCTFSSIFKRYESEFNFYRKDPGRWPDLEKIKLISKKLKEERDQYVNILDILIKKKKTGKETRYPDFKRSGISEYLPQANRISPEEDSSLGVEEKTGKINR